MNKVIRINVDHKGRDCEGCTKCCDGWLSSQIYNFNMGPGDGPCRFVVHKGCSIYELRPKEPCKTFQCGWKENDKIPYFMKPDISNIILLLRFLDGIPFYRMVKCSNSLDQKAIDWANEHSEKGHNLLAYDNEGKLLIFSKNKTFRESAKKHY